MPYTLWPESRTCETRVSAPLLAETCNIERKQTTPSPGPYARSQSPYEVDLIVVVMTHCLFLPVQLVHHLAILSNPGKKSSHLTPNQSRSAPKVQTPNVQASTPDKYLDTERYQKAERAHAAHLASSAAWSFPTLVCCLRITHTRTESELDVRSLAWRRSQRISDRACESSSVPEPPKPARSGIEALMGPR